jgi:hypothetical protein
MQTFQRLRNSYLHTTIRTFAHFICGTISDMRARGSWRQVGTVVAGGTRVHSLDGIGVYRITGFLHSGTQQWLLRPGLDVFEDLLLITCSIPVPRQRRTIWTPLEAAHPGSEHDFFDFREGNVPLNTEQARLNLIQLACVQIRDISRRHK